MIIKLNLNLIESKIAELEHLLSQVPLLWQNEILTLYLQEKIPVEWLEDSFLLCNDHILKFHQTSSLPSSHPWHELSLKLIKCCEIPVFTNDEIHFLKNTNALQIKEKKRHEINQLIQLSQQEELIHSRDHLIDLAGGKGHLTEAYLNYYSSLALSRSIIDNNTQFYVEHLTKQKSFREQYYCLDLLKTSQLPPSPGVSQHLIQLHGCGSLTDQALHFFLSSHAKSLQVVGCCFHRINNPIYFTTNPKLFLTPEALYLATRTYKSLTLENWKKRLNQKHYRYTLEMWFHEMFQRPMPALKSSIGSLYEGSFRDYAKVQLHRLSIKSSKLNLDSLEKCYSKKYALKDSLIKLGMIRMIFARPIEVYIALRRAHSLYKLGANKVLIGEIFNAEISPRNILIFARK